MKKSRILISLLALSLLIAAGVEAKSGGGAAPLCKMLHYWFLGRFGADEHRAIRLRPVLDHSLLAKAEKDECYAGIGKPYPPKTGGKAGDRCPRGSVGKANQSYVWGLTKVGEKDLWFGTVANMLCMRSTAMGSDPVEHSGYWVCENKAAQSGTGDYRPPKIYRYHLASQTLEDKTPVSGEAFELLRNTQGLRSAGNFGGVVFVAGPNLTAKAVNVFAFDADTGALLGFRQYSEYNDIRQWLVLNGVLYTGVANAGARSADEPGGFVLRWTGQKSTDPAVLFRFQVVGKLDSEAANLAAHDGRIYVTTWPKFDMSGMSSGNLPDPATFRYAGLYQSPLVPDQGLSPSDGESWKKVWSVTDYEPDQVAAFMTMGGALYSHEGSLYWGTIVMPEISGGVAILLHTKGVIDLDTNGNGKLDIIEMFNTLLGATRPVTLFRGFGTRIDNREPQVVYGEKYLPLYDPYSRSYTIRYDAEHLNRMGQTPLWGASGFGNLFNTYIWSMSQYDGRLFIGTFDWSQTFFVEPMPPMPKMPDNNKMFAALKTASASESVVGFWGRIKAMLPVRGADLLRIDDSSGRAVFESRGGLGNPTNYGVRTMASGDGALYVGTANSNSLHPRGGWELLQLKRRTK